MPFKSHTFSCAVCRRPTALDPRLGPELIAQLLRDEFAVLGLAKVAPLEPAVNHESIHNHGAFAKIEWRRPEGGARP